MEIFLDTANTNEISHILRWGIIDGITTNQKIFQNEKGVDFETRAREICKMVHPKPVSIESNGTSLEEILSDARKFSKISHNVVAKVAMTGDGKGIEALSTLSKEGIKTNCTVMMNLNQLMLATKAGATYASLFYNRAKDSGVDPILTIKQFSSLTRSHGYKTKLIVGSIRSPADVSDAAAAGADIITIPYKIMISMPFHKKTEETIQEFDKAWKDFLSSTPSQKISSK
jgi:transaldolase